MHHVIPIPCGLIINFTFNRSAFDATLYLCESQIKGCDEEILAENDSIKNFTSSSPA